MVVKSKPVAIHRLISGMPAIFLLILFAGSIHTGYGKAWETGASPNPSGGPMVVVTCLSGDVQARYVRAMVKSIRERGGKYAGSSIHVVLACPEKESARYLKDENIIPHLLEMDTAFTHYPLAVKAFAAAQVERLVRNEAGTLVWLDPGVVVLNGLDDLDLGDRFDAAVRPVSLSNTVSLDPGLPPDAYWAPIYRENNIDYQRLPVMETVVDEVKMQPYYNCEVFSFNPKLGIGAEWARILTLLLKDRTYQDSACGTFLKRLFLHQAVLSGVIDSRVKPERIRPLPITSGYPFNQHGRMAPSKQISSLNELSVVIFDEAWIRDPEWMHRIPVYEPLKQWLNNTCQEYPK